MVRMKGGNNRPVPLPVTPEQDQPKTSRAYPLKVRDAGPSLPFFSGGVRNTLKQADSHPVFGSAGPRRPLKRVDVSQDARREIE